MGTTAVWVGRRVGGLAAAWLVVGGLGSSAGGVGIAGMSACDPAPVKPAAPPTAPAAGARAPAAGSRTPAAGSGQPRQPFAVAIVVDQLSAWMAASRFPELPKDGGIARLVREGTWVKSLRYPYAITDTAPGHTSLHTGKVPAESGIINNETPEASGERVTVLRDATTRPVLEGGLGTGHGSSAARLRVDSVADRLRAARPDALVVSLSVKDRGAILAGGKRPSHVMWYERTLGSFVTSTAFEATYPKWAIGVGDTAAVNAARSRPWELTDAAWVKARSATPDAQAGEGDLDGLGIAFPHVVRTPKAFRATPLGDEMVVRLALAAIDAEYDPARPTLLLLSMSGLDIIGHVFGPDSWEAWDHLRRLDAAIGSLLDALDRRAGAPVHVLLSADHGSISMPEVEPSRAGVVCVPAPADGKGTKASLRSADPFERPCTAGTRLGPTAMQNELGAAATRALGPGAWVSGLADPYLFLTEQARALPAPRRAVLDTIVRTTLAKHPGMGEIFDIATLRAQCPAVLARAWGIPERARLGEDTLTLVCRSWADGAGAGDYYLVPRPGSFFDGEVVVGKGSGHGTPHAYDRTVPMLVRAPGAIAAGGIIEEPVDFAAFAALEAAFAGLDERAPRDILAALRVTPAPARTP